MDAVDKLSKTSQKVFKESTKPLEAAFNQYVAPVLDQDLFKVLVSWFVVVSIVFSVGDLPVEFQNFIKNPIVRAGLTFSGFYVSTRNFTASLAATIGLLLVYHSALFFSEKFEMIWPETDTYPGCVKTTVKDLLDLFNGDESKLKKTMYTSGVPLDIGLTERNAPLIATYLINFGHKVTESCRAPM